MAAEAADRAEEGTNSAAPMAVRNVREWRVGAHTLERDHEVPGLNMDCVWFNDESVGGFIYLRVCSLDSIKRSFSCQGLNDDGG